MPRGAPKAQTLADVPQDGWHAFASSNVIGGNWRGDGILWIRFNLSFYVYTGVPVSIWEGLLAAPSKGKYHAANIKNKFPYIGPIASG